MRARARASSSSSLGVGMMPPWCSEASIRFTSFCWSANCCFSTTVEIDRHKERGGGGVR